MCRSLTTLSLLRWYSMEITKLLCFKSLPSRYPTLIRISEGKIRPLTSIVPRPIWALKFVLKMPLICVISSGGKGDHLREVLSRGSMLVLFPVKFDLFYLGALYRCLIHRRGPCKVMI